MLEIVAQEPACRLTHCWCSAMFAHRCAFTIPSCRQKADTNQAAMPVTVMYLELVVKLISLTHDCPQLLPAPATTTSLRTCATCLLVANASHILLCKVPAKERCS